MSPSATRNETSSASVPRPVSVLRGHQADVQAVVFHPYADILYSGDAAGELKSWNIAARRCTSSVRAYGSILGLCCLHRHGLHAVICQNRNGYFQSFDLDDRTGHLLQSASKISFCTGAYTFCRMASMPDTSSTSSCSSDDKQQQALHPPTSQHADHNSAAPLSNLQDGVDIIACPGEHPACVEIRSAHHGGCLAVLQPHDSEKFGMSMSLALFQRPKRGHDSTAADGSTSSPGNTGSEVCLAVGYEDGRLAIWDLGDLSDSQTGQQGGPVQQQQPLMCTKLHNEPLIALAIDPNNTGGISGSAETTVVCFAIDFARLGIVPEKTLELSKAGVSDLAVRGDSRLFVAALWDGALRIYGRKQATSLAVLKHHTAAATAIAFSANLLLASASRDHSVALWDVYR